jgi:zinc protease
MRTSAENSKSRNSISKWLGIAGFTAFTAIFSPAHSAPDHFTQIKYPPLKYEAPFPGDFRHEIAPGIIAYLYPAPALPLIDMNVIIPANNMVEKKDEVAAVSLLAVMHNKGGTQKMTPGQLDETLEFLSAGISASFNDYVSTLQLNCISKDFDTTLSLLKDIALNPGLDSARLEHSKIGYIEALKHRYDNPSDVSSDLYDFAMYQPHPIFWSATEKDVEKVSQKDLKRHQTGRFAGRPMYLGISGDFEQKEMLVKLKAFFKDWPSVKKTTKAAPIQFKSKKAVYVVDKPVQQATIRIGQPFVQRPHPDYYPASVASYILGSGGFTSRLTARIRTDEGLAYSVFSYTGSDYNKTSTSGVMLKTKAETAAYAIKLIQEEVQRILNEGVTQEEVDRAREGLIASIPSLFDTPKSTAEVFAMSESRGRKLSHFKDYPEALKKVTREDVQKMIRKYFSMENMTYTLVGPKDILMQRDTLHKVSLSDFGPVEMISEDSLKVDY